RLYSEGSEPTARARAFTLRSCARSAIKMRMGFSERDLMELGHRQIRLCAGIWGKWPIGRDSERFGPGSWLLRLASPAPKQESLGADRREMVVEVKQRVRCACEELG